MTNINILHTRTHATSSDILANLCSNNVIVGYSLLGKPAYDELYSAQMFSRYSRRDFFEGGGQQLTTKNTQRDKTMLVKNNKRGGGGDKQPHLQADQRLGEGTTNCNVASKSDRLRDNQITQTKKQQKKPGKQPESRQAAGETTDDCNCMAEGTDGDSSKRPVQALAKVHHRYSPCRPRNKSGRYTGNHDRCIIKFAGQDGCFASHLLIFLFAPILSELVQV